MVHKTPPHRPHEHQRIKTSFSERDASHGAVKAEQELMAQVLKAVGMRPETANDGKRGSHTKHEESEIRALAQKLQLPTGKAGNTAKDEVLAATAEAAMLLAQPDKLASLREDHLFSPSATIASVRTHNRTPG